MVITVAAQRHMLCVLDGVNDDISIALHDGVATDDLSDAIDANNARTRVLDGVDVALNRGLYIRVLKGTITVDHGAVDELEVLAIAQWLQALDLAVD